MASPNAAWGIEIGADALKALRLERDGTNVVVSDFAFIPHKKVLTTPDLDQDEMIRISLGQFISQQSLEGEHLVMSVPGHAAFARFAKLPPVEPKKVPDIVKFEAVQQIPFPIDEVEWDYETFTSDDSPEIEVGIFAITRERVQQRLGLYSELGISPESLTLSPVAVFNAMSFDLSMDESSGPVIFLDIGTQATDVVIAEQGRCWIRTFPLGGTHFTEAIASAFKLSYSKAEKLKKEAATSKYAKQIMQAMRPVFSDLLQDLQRSIGYYQSLHRDHELTEMVGIGSTFKIPGLRKFIGQQLQINVQRLDEFKRISVGGREAASFAEHAVNMASVYGLALQGVGLAPIDANLVPVGALREHMWHAKTKWFAAAAAVIVAGAATTLYHPLVDGAALRAEAESSSLASTVQALGDKEKNAFNALQSDVGATTVNVMALAEDREIWPALLADVAVALDTVDPSGAVRGASIEAIKAVPPEDRKLVLVRNLSGVYWAPDGETQKTRQVAITLELELSHRNPAELLNSTVAEWLRENAEPDGDRADRPYRILPDSVGCSPTKREDIVVGERTARGGGTGGTAPGAARRDNAAGGSRPVRPPSGSGGSTGNPGARRGTPDRQAPPGAGAGGGGNFGAAGGGSRRKTPDRMAPPGAGIGSSGGPGTSGAGPGTGAGTPGGTPSRERTTGEPGQASSPELDSVAPLPERPTIYPNGSTYYRLPITFTIEIIDDAPKMPVDPNA